MRDIANPLRSFLPVIALPIAVTLIIAGCRTTPVSERKQLVIIPEEQEVALGITAYRDILEKEEISTHPQYNALVERVGRRIAAVANRPDYDWEFKVIRSPQQNAFALPGGKVAIYEGILPICQNEAGLAVVMSHEIAHALARHGGERMSHEMVRKGGAFALDIFTRDNPDYDSESVQKAYGVATEFGAILPFSRKHESEADSIGMLLMAEAGYNPEEAVAFWERFGAAKGANQQPEWASTHPSDDRRANDLRKMLPQAVEQYAKARVRFGNGEPILPARFDPSREAGRVQLAK